MIRHRRILIASLVGVAVAVYAVMWVGYARRWGWLAQMDWALLNAAHAVAVEHPLWTRCWDVVSIAVGPVPLRLVGSAAAAVALVQRNVRAALVLLACAPLGGLVTVAAKGLVNRPRPPTMLVAASSTSFPSGHALEAMAALLAMSAFAWPMLSRPAARAALAAIVAVGVVAVGIARVALNVHYPSDVLAGWSLGYLYFVLCLLVFRPSWSRRGDPTAAEALLDP